MEDSQGPNPVSSSTKPLGLSPSPLPIHSESGRIFTPISRPVRQGLSQNVIGQCVVYSASKDLAGVPLPGPGAAFARVFRKKLPKDTLQRFSKDYISAFVDIFGSVANGYIQGLTGTSTNSELPVLKEVVTTTSSESIDLMTPSTEINGTQPLERRRPGRPRKHPHVVPSPDTVSTRRRRRRRRRKSLTEENSSERANSTLSSLPVRQSERRIRTELLQNAVLDDDLGIGIDDDQNQRRSWHKPRVHPREIKEHRIAGNRIVFLVQQTAGNSEWLDESVVDQDLLIKYKMNVFGSDFNQEFPRPLRSSRRKSKKVGNSPDDEVPVLQPRLSSDQPAVTWTSWTGTP